MSNAGPFAINVSAPYPAWCDLIIDGNTVGRFHHRELADLKFTVVRAMHEARLMLGDRSNEI